MRGGKFRIFIAGVLLLYCLAVVYRYGAGYPELFSLKGYLLYLWSTAGSRLLLVFSLWVSAFGLGGAVFGRWLPTSGSLLEEGLMKSALGLILISYAMFLLGVLGLLYTVTGYALLAVGLGLGARGILDFAGRASRIDYEIRPKAAGALLVGVSAYFLIKGFLDSLMPPIGFDVLMYHLGVPKLYINAHSIYLTPDINGSYFPFGTEMLYLLAMLVEGPVSATLVNYSFAVAGGLAAALFARRFFTGAAPLLAFALYVSMPAVFWLMPQAYVELAMAFYTALGLYAMFLYFKEDDRRTLYVAALLAGFTMAIKYTGIVTFGIMAAGLVIERAMVRRSGLRGTALASCVFVGLGAAVSVLWYAKNVVFYGNPIYPILDNLIHGSVSSGTETTATFLSGGPLVMAQKTVSSLWRTTFEAGSFMVGWSSGLGPYFLMLIPGIAFFKNTPSGLKYTLIFCLLMYLALLPTGNIRYMAPMFPVLAALAAYPAGMLMKDESRALRSAGLALVAVFALSAFFANTDREKAMSFASSSPEAMDAYYSRNGSGFLASYNTWKWINGNLPKDAVVYQLWDDASVFFRERETLGSPLPFGHASRSLIHRIQGANGFGGYLPGQEIIENLHKMDAGYLLINANREGRALPEDPYFSNSASLIHEDKGVFLFRLNQ